MSPYRSDASQRARLLNEIAQYEARFTPVFWSDVAPSWRVPLPVHLDEAPLEALHARIAELETTLARAARGVAAELALPFGTVAYAERVEKSVFIAQIGSQSSPFAALPKYLFEHDGTQVVAKGPVEVGLWTLECTVSLTAALELRPEGMLQDVLDAIGIFPELKTQDHRFDPVFVVRGDESTARCFLTAEVRHLLRRLAEVFTPTLRVHKGVATLRCALHAPAHGEYALSLLAKLHALPPPRPIVHEGV